MKLVRLRGGPMDGQTKFVATHCKAVVCPDYEGGFPYGQWRYEPSGHIVNGLPEWVAAGPPAERSA